MINEEAFYPLLNFTSKSANPVTSLIGQAAQFGQPMRNKVF